MQRFDSEPAIDYDAFPMSDAANSLNPEARAKAKQRARVRDQADLSAGRRSIEDLKAENEVFAPLARSARMNLSASQRLG